MKRFVRCIDNTLQRDVLIEGKVYLVTAERDGTYRLDGHGDYGFSKGRFKVAEDTEDARN